MTIEKIPFPYSFDDCNPRYRLLHQVNTMFKNKNEPISVSPLFKLMSILKEKFCTSCSLRSLDEAFGHSDSIEVILEDMKKLRDSNSEQDYITGCRSSTDETFLAVNMPDIDIKEPFVMILWRKGRIFTPEDVIIAKTCITLFFALCRDNYATIRGSNTQIDMKDVMKYAISQPEDNIPSQTLSYLYGEALDLVCKCVVIANKEGSLIHMNQCAEALFKRPISSEEMTTNYTGGIDWFAGLLHPDDLQNLVSTWNTAQHTKEGFTVEFRLQIAEHKTEYHMFRCMSRPVKDPNESVDYWIFCMYDMEQMRLMEETKLAAGRKTKFLAEMSHEIRTPLACVIGTCSLLRYTPLSKEQSDLINTIRVCSQQLFTLTNNILDLSKIEESKLLLEARPVNLERTLTDVVDIFVPDLVRKNVDIAVNICYPEVPESIISDESRLKQILTNILSNAIKYTRDDSTICIHVRKIGGDCAMNSCPAKLQFEISDEGPGIPDTIPQSQLFDTFVQLDSSTYRKYGGSGLGLTISKKLVNLLNGEIWYESEVGKGTTMFFTISLKEPTAIELVDTPIGSDTTSSFRHLWSLREFVNTLKSSSSIRILIAMQKPRMNEFLVRLLRKASVMTVMVAAPDSLSCANALIAEIIKQEPTILITDMTHEDELKKVVHDSLVKGVILFDGQQESHISDDGKAFRSLRKPLKPALLIKTLHEMLLLVLSHFESSIDSPNKIEGDFTISPPRSKWLSSPATTPESKASPTSIASSSKVEAKREVLSRPADLSTSSFASAYPLRLMLAEDNLLNQQLMTRILAKYGYIDLFVVDNGRQAFEVFRRLAQQQAQTHERPIEAIFMDMQMPEVEGPEATHLIRSFCHQTGCPQPHIMALTAKAFSEDRAECMRAGMCSYLSKPVRWTTLEEELIKAHETVHDRIRCICNEERMETLVIEEETTDDEKCTTEFAGSEFSQLPVAKSTGLDV